MHCFSKEKCLLISYGTHHHRVQRCIQDEESSRDTNCNMQAANPEDFVTRGGPRIGCPSGSLSLQQNLGELDATIKLRHIHEHCKSLYNDSFEIDTDREYQ